MKRKLWMGLLSVLIAFGLWMYVVSVVAPESKRTYFDIPVKLHGEEVLKSRGLMLVAGQNSTVDLTLSGTRTELNNLSGASIAVYADLSGITSAGTHMVHYTVSNLGAISVIEPQTQAITVTVVEYAEKEIPIEVEALGQTPSEYTEDWKTLATDRKTVIISGAKETVDKVKRAVVTVNLDGRTSDIDEVLPITFLDENENAVELAKASADTTQVTVVMKVYMVKTVDIVVELIPSQDLTEQDAGLELQFETLDIYGPASVLQNISYVTVTVDLADLSENGELSPDIVLPDGVYSQDGITNVTVNVTVPPLVTENRLISQWSFINQPEGVEIKTEKSQIMVMIRGRKHRMDQLKDEDIVLVVDLSDAAIGLGVYTVEVQIRNVDGIEVLGHYTIELTLEEKNITDNPSEE